MSILETGTQITGIDLAKGIDQTAYGWYFYFKDGSCRIGPYNNENDCRSDYDKYLKTGRISTDEKRKLIIKEG
jgi:hypothetical protein